MSLRLVPDDEIEQVSHLLEQHNIEYYFTSAGSFGISLPAIWIKHDWQFELAKNLLDQYQQQRATSARQKYRELVKSNTNNSMLDNFLQQPLKFIGYIIAILFFIYILLLPVMYLSK